METIFAIADGAHREHHMHFAPLRFQAFNGLQQVVGTCVYAQLLFLKQLLRALLAVIYNLARFLEPIDMVGSQRDEGHKPSICCLPFGRHPFYGV